MESSAIIFQRKKNKKGIFKPAINAQLIKDFLWVRLLVAFLPEYQLAKIRQATSDLPVITIQYHLR